MQSKAEEIFLETAKERLRRRGCRLTGPRLAILRFLLRENGHLDMQEIFHGTRAEHPGIGMATIYRTIDLFLEVGVISALSLKGSRVRYEVNWPENHHHHLICTGCGQVIEFGSCSFPLIAGEIEKVTRFKIHEHELEAYGHCPQCAAEGRSGLKADHSTENT